MTGSSGSEGPAGIPEEKWHELLAAAMADPVRGKILIAAAEPTFLSGAAETAGTSIREISDRVQESRRRVRYHLDALCRQGLVEVVEERRRRGVIEHFYRTPFVPFLSKEQVEGIPPERQQKIILSLLKEIFSDATAALESGTFARRPEWAAARFHADVDERGWEELGAIFEKTAREALEIIEKSRERLQQTNEEPIRLGGASLLFEATDRSGPPEDS